MIEKVALWECLRFLKDRKLPNATINSCEKINSIFQVVKLCT